MPVSKKTRRIRMLAFGAAALAGSAALVAMTFDDTIAFFKSPTEILAEQPGPEQRLRIGGLVAEGSVVRGEGEVVRFDVTDGGGSVTVSFTGVLPDLFREGQGIIAEGRMQGGAFLAEEVLAKHDENYMPREVADALKAQGVFRGSAE